MAHEIDMTTGKAAVFVTGEPAWHRLGRVIESAATSAEAIDLAGLNWNVEQYPVRAFLPDEQDYISCPNTVANVRTDTRRVLGVVSTSYRVFQNRECFDFMDSLVGEKLAMYETAGALFEGRRVWMLARIPKAYQAASGDEVKPYVLLTNSHDGTRALRMIPTTIRVVCNNTLSLALNRAGKAEGISISHHPCLDVRVAAAKKALGLITLRFDRFGEELAAMVRRQLTGAELRAYFNIVLPQGETERAKKSRLEVLGKLEDNFLNPRNAMPGIRGSVWAAYNAVSEFADHQQNFRGKDTAAKLNNQLNSIWFGTAHKLKQNAYATALDLASATA